ncbi:MAG: N-acetylneuraminate synthase [Nitrospiraceae bacterium]|nr:N-acetylneuraminate synthase [Nitrospiraceae bacterium]
MPKTFIIAEAGVNHNGSLDMATRLIDVAVEAGADAVKFQTFRAEKVVSRTAPKAAYQTVTTGSSESQFEMIKKLELNEDAHRLLIAYCAKREIQFLSTAFDPESVDLLDKTFNLPILKIPSGEITNAPLLLHAAHAKKPIILSTGMSTLGEIEAALGVLAFGYLEDTAKPSMNAFQAAFCSEEGQEVLAKMVTLLHCTTEYPAPFSEVNLRAMDSMNTAFGLPVGYSDHTEGIAIAVAAAARGAVVIEKHFTLDRNLPGPDHKASLNPVELQEMVRAIRQVESALGLAHKVPSLSEMKNRSVVRRSLVAEKDIKQGVLFDEANMVVKRPGTGVSPMQYWDYLGTQSDKEYFPDQMIGE